jgi:hypothetical protein
MRNDIKIPEALKAKMHTPKRASNRYIKARPVWVMRASLAEPELWRSLI